MEERFVALQRMNCTAGLNLTIPELLMKPIVAEIPAVENGFVYLLVSLRDESYCTTFADETNENLLEDLSRHNSGYKEGVTSKQHLRPWSIAAFAFNFSNYDQRIALKNRIAEETFFLLRVDTLMREFHQLTQSGAFGNAVFVQCGSLINTNKE